MLNTFLKSPDAPFYLWVLVTMVLPILSLGTFVLMEILS